MAIGKRRGLSQISKPAPIRLTNKQARKLAINVAGLARNPQGRAGPQSLQSLIDDLGFVQIDTISTIARAHDHILWARLHSYNPDTLKHLAETKGSLFEHWSHDAAFIPTQFRPFWQHRFARYDKWKRSTPGHWKRLGKDPEATIAMVLDEVRNNGPMKSADFKSKKPRPNGGWWDWAEEKVALDYLWRIGKLGVAGRESFHKRYDLAERLFDPHPEISKDEYIDWACRSALQRLGFATPRQIAHFWSHLKLDEVKGWLADCADVAEGHFVGADGAPHAAFVLADTPVRLKAAKAVPKVVRLLSPFDPLIHDRERTEKLFGFDYRLEAFVPEPKRQYGYFVCPILEGDQLIGRIDLKAHRKEKPPQMELRGLWFEPDVKLTRDRQKAVIEAVALYSDFCGVAPPPDSDFKAYF